MNLRVMTKADAPRVAEIQVLSWKKTYESILEKEYLHSLDIKKKIIIWENGMDVNSDVLRFVFCSKKKVLGFVIGVEGEDAELAALYVDPEHLGKKIGTKLFQEISFRFKKLHHSSFFLWVLEENTSARKFYEKQGGQLLSARKEITLGNKSYPQVAYRFKTF